MGGEIVKDEVMYFSVILSVISFVLVILLAQILFFSENTLPEIKLWEYELVGYNDTMEKAWTCYPKEDYYDCYITPSTHYAEGTVCVGCSDDVYYYKCFPDTKKCILIAKYKRI